MLAIYDVGVGTPPYLVTELLDGETLRARMIRSRLALGAILDTARQFLSGLAAAHGRGIVHRDLKPDNLPGAHATLGWWTTLHEWSFPRAEQIFQHALSLDDACIEAHAFFGLLCGTLQREDDVVAHMSPWTHGVSAFAHHTLGRDEVALRESATALGLRADSMIGLWCKGVALRGLNRFPEAIATFERAAELMPSALYLLCELGCTCARAGDSARAEGILRTLDERATMVDVAPFWRGTILFGLGRVDEAYADLERGLPPSVAQARGPGVDPNIR